MASSTVEVHDGAVFLDLSTDQLGKLGWQNGQRIEVSQSGDSLTLRPCEKPDRSVIRSAMAHLESAVGFNTGIGRPNWVGQRFEVKAYRSFDQRYLGTLYFTMDGQLIKEASTPDAAMRDLADAP